MKNVHSGSSPAPEKPDAFFRYDSGKLTITPISHHTIKKGKRTAETGKISFQIRGFPAEWEQNARQCSEKA
jgi:hypothetical protein